MLPILKLLSNLINSVGEVAESSVEEEEQRIFDIYEPAPVQESDSDADNIQDVDVISYKARLSLPPKSVQRKTRVLYQAN